MAEVVWLEGAKAATNGVPVETVLEKAKKACMEVVVIGYNKDGNLYCSASFPGDAAAQTVWIMEQAKAWLLAGCPEQE